MLTRASSAQVTPASLRLLNVNGVPYFWPLRLSRRAGGASVGGEARKAAALLPAATCCGCGAGAGTSAAWRSAATIRGAALTIAPTKTSISPWLRTMGGGYRQMPALSATRKRKEGQQPSGVYDPQRLARIDRLRHVRLKNGDEQPDLVVPGGRAGEGDRRERYGGATSPGGSSAGDGRRR